MLLVLNLRMRVCAIAASPFIPRCPGCNSRRGDRSILARKQARLRNPDRHQRLFDSTLRWPTGLRSVPADMDAAVTVSSRMEARQVSGLPVLRLPVALVRRFDTGLPLSTRIAAAESGIRMRGSSSGNSVLRRRHGSASGSSGRRSGRRRLPSSAQAWSGSQASSSDPGNRNRGNPVPRRCSTLRQHRGSPSAVKSSLSAICPRDT